jgi:small-conductance mechanosensitive channel
MNGISDLTQLVAEKLNVNLIYGEILVAILIFSVFIIIGWLVYFIFSRYLTKFAERTKTKLDDEILKNIKTPIYLIVILLGAYYGSEAFSFLGPYSELLAKIFLVAEILLVTFIITRIVNILISWYSEKSAKDRKKVSEHLLFIFKKVIQAFIYICALLVILSVFKVDLSGIVLGLGVGGIAIALALQNILGDVFSAFSIYFDRPFEIGDFIVVDEYMGTVKKIGIKSTRIQLLQGEELVISNRQLTNASIRNFKRMRQRRIVFTIGVTYDTPVEKLKKIPDIVKDIINPKKLPDVEKLERVHFKEFGDFSLNFEIVYYMKTRDYLKYMDTQQAINLAIKESFEKEGIEMAFPTQTIYLNKVST